MDSAPSKKFSCDHCPQLLASSWGLNQHKMVVHKIGEFKYKCDHCNKGFTIPSKLKKHKEGNGSCRAAEQKSQEENPFPTKEPEPLEERRARSTSTEFRRHERMPSFDSQDNSEELKSGRKNRNRTVLTAAQIKHLEGAFRIQSMWGNYDEEQQEMLQQDTGLEKRVIRTWFSNRNAKFKRERHQTGTSAQHPDMPDMQPQAQYSEPKQEQYFMSPPARMGPPLPFNDFQSMAPPSGYPEMQSTTHSSGYPQMQSMLPPSMAPLNKSPEQQSIPASFIHPQMQSMAPLAFYPELQSMAPSQTQSMTLSSLQPEFQSVIPSQDPDQQSIAPQHPEMQSMDPQHREMQSMDPQHPEMQSIAPQHPEMQSMDPQHPEMQSISPQHQGQQSMAPQHSEIQSIAPQQLKMAPQHPESQSMAPQHSERQSMEPQLLESQSMAPQQTEMQSIAPQHPEMQSIAPQHPEMHSMAPQHPEMQYMAPQHPEMHSMAPLRPEMKSKAPQLPDQKSVATPSKDQDLESLSPNAKNFDKDSNDTINSIKDVPQGDLEILEHKNSTGISEEILKVHLVEKVKTEVSEDAVLDSNNFDETVDSNRTENMDIETQLSQLNSIKSNLKKLGGSELLAKIKMEEENNLKQLNLSSENHLQHHENDPIPSDNDSMPREENEEKLPSEEEENFPSDNEENFPSDNEENFAPESPLSGSDQGQFENDRSHQIQNIKSEPATSHFPDEDKDFEFLVMQSRIVEEVKFIKSEPLDQNYTENYVEPSLHENYPPSGEKELPERNIPSIEDTENNAPYSTTQNNADKIVPENNITEQQKTVTENNIPKQQKTVPAKNIPKHQITHNSEFQLIQNIKTEKLSSEYNVSHNRSENDSDIDVVGLDSTEKHVNPSINENQPLSEKTSDEYYLDIIRKAAKFDDIKNQFNAKSEEELYGVLRETISKSSKYDELKNEFEKLEYKYLKSYEKIRPLEDSGIGGDSRDYLKTPTSMNISSSQNSSSAGSSPECSSTPIIQKKRNPALNSSSDNLDPKIKVKTEINSERSNTKQVSEQTKDLSKSQDRFNSSLSADITPDPKSANNPQSNDQSLSTNNPQMSQFRPDFYNQTSGPMQNLNPPTINPIHQALQQNFGFGPNSGFNQLGMGYNQFNPTIQPNAYNQAELMRYQQMNQHVNGPFNNFPFPNGMFPFNQNMPNQFNMPNFPNLNQLHNLYNQPLNNSENTNLPKEPLNELNNFVNSQLPNKTRDSSSNEHINSEESDNSPLDLSKTSSPTNLSKEHSTNSSEVPVNLTIPKVEINPEKAHNLNHSISTIQSNIANNISDALTRRSDVPSYQYQMPKGNEMNTGEMPQMNEIKMANFQPQMNEMKMANFQPHMNEMKMANFQPHMNEMASFQFQMNEERTKIGSAQPGPPLVNSRQDINLPNKLPRDGMAEKVDMWVCALKEGFPDGWKKQSLKKNDRSKKEGFYFRLIFKSPQGRSFSSRKSAIDYMTSSGLYSEEEISRANGWPKRRKSYDDEGGPIKRFRPDPQDGWREAEGLPNGWKMKPVGSWRPGAFTYRNQQGRVLRSARAAIEFLKSELPASRDDLEQFQQFYAEKCGKGRSGERPQPGPMESGNLNITEFGSTGRLPVGEMSVRPEFNGGISAGPGSHVSPQSGSSSNGRLPDVPGSSSVGGLSIGAGFTGGSPVSQASTGGLPFAASQLSNPSSDILKSLQNISRISITKC